MVKNAGDADTMPQEIFGIPLPQGTGAMGTPGIPDAEDDQDLASVKVVNNFQSVQGTMVDTYEVGTGDTSGMSNDMPINQSPLAPEPPAAYLHTGSGEGHVRGPDHPNAGR
jgi:hypothetical protein